MATIETLSDLEAAVGARPPTAHLKSIATIDEHCAEFLSRSTFAVLGVQDDSGGQDWLAFGGEHGKVLIPEPAGIRLPEHPSLATWGDGSPAGVVALVPGYRETLRLNGRLRGRLLVLEEAFLHCAKCMIRSDLWGEHAISATPAPVEPVEADLEHPAIAAFLAQARFAAIVSTDAHGHTDVSPKGDPAGFLTVLGPDRLALPDRPGNRRTDTFHNLVEHPDVALLALAPGQNRALRVRGRATISDDLGLRERMAVKGNVPKVALVIGEATASLADEPAIEAARLWDTGRHIADGELPRASRIWTDHVKLNQDPGLAAKVARAAASEHMLRAGLAADYKHNLY